MYNTPLGEAKYVLYAQLPDHTGNVGQFSMANEPSMHIPYLYNYIGEPWSCLLYTSRAWTYEKGWKAPQCAGVIHTDFEKGFICAEVIKYDDYIKYGSEAAVKEAGKLGDVYKRQDKECAYWVH